MKHPAHSLLLLGLCLLGGLTACSSGRMLESADDPQSGRRHVREYSRFYDTGEWLQEGKLGLQLAITHEKTFIPIVYDVQKALDAIGVPGAFEVFGQTDQQAVGKITFYFVNLELQNRRVQVLRVSSATQERTPGGAKEVIAGARTQTPVAMGSVPILNYGKQIQLNVEYEIDGITTTKSFMLQRRTAEELETYFSRAGRPPYPWYQAPYYPFRPPLLRPRA